MEAIQGRSPAILAFVTGAILFVLSTPALAEPAGRVVFVSGSVLATDLTGNARALERGAAVEEGDTIATGEGRVQVQFKDGAFMALQPQTRFKVARYRYTAAGDDEDSAVMSLIKGGLRTISGLVGKKNRDAYRMETEVATIGIRGTDYALDLNASLSGHVSDGAIEVCNGAGCTMVQGGFAFLVPSFTQPPALSERRAFLPPTPSDGTRAGVMSNIDEVRGSSGDVQGADPGVSPRAFGEAGDSSAGAAFDSLPQPRAPGNANFTAGAPTAAGAANAAPKPGNAASAPGQTKTPSAATGATGLPADPGSSIKLPPGLAKKLNDPLSDGAGPPGLTKKLP